MGTTGVKLVRVGRDRDERGSSRQIEFDFPVVRSLEVFSRRGVIRGMHFQDWRVAPLHKSVLVVRGEILDFVFDLRQVPPRGQEFLLHAESPSYLVIPPWCAHGYAALEDSLVLYSFDAARCQRAERIIHWRSLPIPWPDFPGGPILSDKDRDAPALDRVLEDLARPISG
jgi:dTDP-4-dehydrorhamnose 3,5-epimerase